MMPRPTNEYLFAELEVFLARADTCRNSFSMLVHFAIRLAGSADARRVLADKGLIAIEPGSARPPATGELPSGAVTDQSPESGARVPAGSSVTLWVGRGGGSAGVREPRRPLPVVKSAHEERERSDEAVG